MAAVRIIRTWPDGESIDEVQAWAENTYPVAVAVAVARANALIALQDATRDAMEDAPTEDVALPSDDE